AADGRRPLKRVLADVHDRRHVGRDLLARPAVGLLYELVFEIIDPDRTEISLGEIENFVARRWTLPGQQIQLVISIEVIFVAAIAKGHSLQQLLADVWVARRRGERRQPIKTGEDPILDASGLDLSG